MKALISKSFDNKQIFENLEIEILEGEVTCVLGASGVGKTTFLRILAGLEPFKGNIENAPKKCSFVFQDARLLPYLTVEENLRYVGGGETRINEALEKAEIAHLKTQKANTLSGGEKQRVSFARAFATQADVMLLDEPFSSLDTALKIRLWKTFASLWEDNKCTAVLVTHDLEEAWALGHRILVIEKGKIALDIRPTRSVYPTPYGENSKEKTEFINKILQ